MKVVLDTNVIVSAFVFPKGPPAQVLKAQRSRRFELLLSEDILAEYQKVLGYARLKARHGMDDDEIIGVIEEFQDFGVVVEITTTLDVVKQDPDDNKFLECAVAGEADYIVSGDAHLLALRQYEGTQILSPSVFLAFLSQL